jgi:hypothetical protein
MSLGDTCQMSHEKPDYPLQNTVNWPISYIKYARKQNRTGRCWKLRFAVFKKKKYIAKDVNCYSYWMELFSIMLWLANRNGKDFVEEAMDVDLRQLICEWTWHRLTGIGRRPERDVIRWSGFLEISIDMPHVGSILTCSTKYIYTWMARREK